MNINHIPPSDIIACRAEIRDIVEKSSSFSVMESRIQEKMSSQEATIRYVLSIQVIPEDYLPDSSEEKRWAKASDVILSNAFAKMGMSSEVIRVRGDSADIRATYTSSGQRYTLVADAKCFRLSRTAKNQKDFKIKSIADWRRDDTYAMLCAPLFAYPKGKSQIYRQAFSDKVLLFSYIHIVYALESGVELLIKCFRSLFNEVQSRFPIGDSYWQELNRLVIGEGKDEGFIRQILEVEHKLLSSIGDKEREYYELQEANIEKMSREELINELKRMKRIDNRRLIIKETLNSYRAWIENTFIQR